MAGGEQPLADGGGSDVSIKISESSKTKEGEAVGRTAGRPSVGISPRGKTKPGGSEFHLLSSSKLKSETLEDDLPQSSPSSVKSTRGWQQRSEQAEAAHASDSKDNIEKFAELKPKAKETEKGRPRKVSTNDKATADIPSGNSVVDFDLKDVTNQFCAVPPEFLDVRDGQLSLAILGDVELDMLDDMVRYFLISEGVNADEKLLHGPPKWSYNPKSDFDNFDFYAAHGCINCGAAYDFSSHQSFHLSPPALVCRDCGHCACPLHFETEGETYADREEKHPSTSSSSSDIPGAVYLRGSRQQYCFGQNEKEWWQSQFLPHDLRMADLHRTMKMIVIMSKLKAPSIQELCEVCGNNQAYFHTYQARSADEGMTIMYECTRCHARKTFNN